MSLFYNEHAFSRRSLFLIASFPAEQFPARTTPILFPVNIDRKALPIYGFPGKNSNLIRPALSGRCIFDLRATLSTPRAPFLFSCAEFARRFAPPVPRTNRN